MTADLAPRRDDVTPPVSRGAVLVTEDDRDFRSIVSSYLRAKGWLVVALENGATALELARHERFDAVVLDIRSAGSFGLNVLHALRAEGLRLPAVVITSFGDASLTQYVRKIGATRVIAKPFDLVELERALGETCSTAPLTA